ncbi:MAG: PQQ-binding-like beta-propeller repeat protein, partial [Planctomycetota bacterium]
GGTIRQLGLFADRVVEVSTFPSTASIVGQPSSAGALLRGVERSTGVLIWEQPVLFGSVATPPDLETFAAAAASPAGNLFVVSGRADGDNLLAAFDAQTGARQWVIDTDTVPELTSFGSSALLILAVDPTGSTIVGAGVSGLAAFDASNGQVLWARTGFDLAQALPSAISSLLGFGDLEVGSQSVYLTGTAGLPLVAALDLATGVASFDRALLGNSAGTLRLDATEQHLAVASVDFNIFFGGTLQTFINVVDASTGVTVAATNFVQGAGELQWDSAGTELYGIQLTDSSQSQQLIQNASVWALDVLQNQVLYNELIAPSFGVDRVASSRLRVGPQGDLLVAVAAAQPDLVPVAQAGVELISIDPATGSGIGSIPIDGGLVEAPQPLMALEADASGSAVGAIFRDSQVGSGAVRTTNVDALGNVTWTSDVEATGPTQQSVLRVASSPDGTLLYVSELIGSGIQVRALTAQDGTELWRTQFAERAIFTSGQFVFGGDLVATEDGSRLGLVFQAFGPGQAGLVEGVFVTLDAATGAVQWQNLVPQLHIGAASAMDQRTVLLHDTSEDRWILAGGSGEDVVRAFDAAGNPLWSQELPTPAAGPDTIFDGIAEFA